MPVVNGKHFSYTPEGMKAAAAARKKKKRGTMKDLSKELFKRKRSSGK